MHCIPDLLRGSEERRVKLDGGWDASPVSCVICENVPKLAGGVSAISRAFLVPSVPFDWAPRFTNFSLSLSPNPDFCWFTKPWEFWYFEFGFEAAGSQDLQ